MMFIDSIFNMFYRNSLQIRLRGHISKLSHFPEMSSAVTFKLLKIMDGYTCLDGTQCFFCGFLYLFKEAEDLLKARFVEDEHHTAPTHTIYVFIEKKNGYFHTIIAAALLPYCKTM